ncbi:hypothetical protein MMC20_002231 [Loxospora ochrophaea]|nr:hypothetical protein [Loxospora ochrophaea]
MESSVSSLFSIDAQRAPFRFFDLPAELRRKILSNVLIVDQVIDIDSRNHRRLTPRLETFLTSRRFHQEAYPVFYGGNTFRILPVGSKRQPLLTSLPSHYRAALIALELRLGPNWSKPPKSWKVEDKLGLEDAVAVRGIRVFVEVDPSHEIFNGFRVDEGFYTNFSGAILEAIMKRLPALEEVHFNGYPSVSREAPLIKHLLEISLKEKKRISWGPCFRAERVLEGSSDWM